jgi:hypothetical protein
VYGSYLNYFQRVWKYTKEVSENFNSFFSTVADKIGHNVVYDPSTHPRNMSIMSKKSTLNRFGGVMVSLLASSAVDSGFEPRSGQTKDYKIGIGCFSTGISSSVRKHGVELEIRR